MVDMGDDGEVTDAGDVGHLARPLAGRSTERKGAIAPAIVSLRRRDAQGRPARERAA
jgi:hypothetical protein